MKVTAGKIIVALAIAVVVIGFLFLSDVGLTVQGNLAERMGYPAYFRFITQRLTNNPNAMYFSAQELQRLAFEDLFRARQMADRAIELHPNDGAYYYLRGRINLAARRYPEAKKDFETGLSCWQYNFGRIPTQADLSNALIEATGCLEVHQKAWGKTD